VTPFSANELQERVRGIETVEHAQVGLIRVAHFRLIWSAFLLLRAPERPTTLNASISPGVTWARRTTAMPRRKRDLALLADLLDLAVSTRTIPLTMVPWLTV